MARPAAGRRAEPAISGDVITAPCRLAISGDRIPLRVHPAIFSDRRRRPTSPGISSPDRGPGAPRRRLELAGSAPCAGAQLSRQTLLRPAQPGPRGPQAPAQLSRQRSLRRSRGNIAGNSGPRGPDIKRIAIPPLGGFGRFPIYKRVILSYPLIVE
jgi:hypothetical protein